MFRLHPLFVSRARCLLARLLDRFEFKVAKWLAREEPAVKGEVDRVSPQRAAKRAEAELRAKQRALRQRQPAGPAGGSHPDLALSPDASPRGEGEAAGGGQGTAAAGELPA